MNLTTASDDTALGDSALANDPTGTGNAALGDSALFNNTTGDGNTAIGTGALAGNINGHNNIGVGLLAGEKPVTGLISSLNRAEETPVTFHYRPELDPEGIPQFGLVAEQVEKVDPDLVARDEQGKPYTVRYEAVNAMLLNEFLKEHHKVESLENAMAEQQKENAAMRAMLKEQGAQIQRVSAQLELSKPVSQTIAKNQ